MKEIIRNRPLIFVSASLLSSSIHLAVLQSHCTAQTGERRGWKTQFGGSVQNTNGSVIFSKNKAKKSSWL